MKFIKMILCFLLLSSLVLPVAAFDVDSESVIVYDVDNECILYQKNATQQRQVASLTKLVAILVAIDQIDNLQEEIIVDGEVIQGYYDYTKVGLKDGDVVTYENLLYGMMLPSGADASLLITHHVAGSEEEFAKLMNLKAREIGMSRSMFDNAVGCDSEENYSTAYDLLKLLKYAMNNKTFLKIFTTQSYDIIHLGIEMESTIAYYNEFLEEDTSFIKGSKTGYTDKAGYCLASLSTHENHPIIIITLGGDEDVMGSALKDTITIYDMFTKNYHYDVVLEENQSILSLPIKLGWKKMYEVCIPQTYYGYVEDKDNLQVEYVGVDEITRDIKKGDLLAHIFVRQNGEVLAECPIVLEKTLFYHYPILYVLVVLMAILYILFLKKKRRRNRRKRRKKQ